MIALRREAVDAIEWHTIHSISLTIENERESASHCVKKETRYLSCRKLFLHRCIPGREQLTRICLRLTTYVAHAAIP